MTDEKPPYAYPDLSTGRMPVPYHPIPRMEGMDDDPRGFPIPFVCRTNDGGYHFDRPEDARIVQCVTRNLCAICAQPLGYWITFIGGEVELDARYFLWPAMHHACAITALSLCPHLALSGREILKERRAVEDGTHAPAEKSPAHVGAFTTRTQELVKGGAHPVVHAGVWKFVQWGDDPDPRADIANRLHDSD